MKRQASVKVIVDLLMTVLLMLLMAFELIGRQAHEWIGTAMFVAFVIHHILNRKWTSHLLKGTYTPIRIFQTVLVVLVLVCILASMVSGMVMSRYVFDFLPIEGGRSQARIIHMLGAYWGFVCMSLHLGVHWNMMMGMAGKAFGKSSPARTWLLRAAGILLAGCGSETDSAQENTSEETAQTEDQAVTDTEDTDGGSSGNVLIVYYSATGNTETAANYIADATGGTLFELEPAESYTDEDLNYNDENSRVSREHEDESLQDVELVSTTVEGFDEYDTVFIGYPIWWGEAAWPVNQFVENNDFTGKTVIPFATSASSGFGESGQLLADMAGTGDWQEGMRFGSSPDEAEVQEWIDGLGL